MSADVFTQKTITSPIGRMKGGFGSILFGIILLIAGGILLFWNEGRAIKRLRTLEEGQSALIELSADQPLNPQNDEKLVYISGVTSVDGESFDDNLFNASFSGVSMERRVQMYQWLESKETSTKEDSDGNEVKTTTYSYSKGWSGSPQDSSQFAKFRGHENPTMPFNDQSYQANVVRVGPLQLSAALVGKIENAAVMPLDDSVIPEHYKGHAKIVNDEILIGANAADQPEIGDLKVWFSITEPCEVSVIAQQKQQMLTTFYMEQGKLEVLKTGSFTSDELFAAEKKSNTLITWGIRIGGWLLVYVGTAVAFSIIDVLASFIPFLGGIIRAGVGLIVFVMATVMSLVIVSIGWVFYRPLLGGSILAFAVVLLALPLLRQKRIKS